jgi:hypothetical protein
VSTTVSGRARFWLVGPTTGPHAPSRLQSARSSGDCACLLPRRVTHRPSHPSSRGPKTTVRRALRPASCRP